MIMVMNSALKRLFIISFCWTRYILRIIHTKQNHLQKTALVAKNRESMKSSHAITKKACPMKSQQIALVVTEKTKIKVRRRRGSCQGDLKIWLLRSRILAIIGE